MGYFSSKNDTNIDNEFDKKKSFNFHFDKKKLMIIMIVLVLIIGVIIGIASFTNKGSYSITLDGEQNIKIYLDSEYIEPGYYGYDKKGNDITEQVEVINNVNTKEIGDYTVTYSFKNEKVIRNVSVVDKGIGTTYLYLNGDKTMYLKPGESYTEPGYVVVDTIDTNLKDKVVIDGTVDTSKPGSYRLVYSVVNSTGVTTSATRTVIVLGSEISLSLSTKSSTAGPIYINVSVKDNYFDYLVLPDGSKVTDSEYSYKVTKNNTYKFIVYDTFGNKTEESIKVSNIKVNTGSSSGSSGSSTGSSGNSGSSSTQKPTVTIATPKVYTSDNITSGNKHSVGFLMKLTSSDGTIYYCLDSKNTCNPSTKYTKQLRFAESGQKYLRYKACNSENECSNVGSYKVNLNIQLVNPDESSSGGIANPYQAAYYYQADSRWANYYVSSSYKMRKVGCGFNAFSMIVTGITHNYKYTPDEVYNALKQIKNDYGVKFQDSYTGGGLLDTAVVDKNVANYFEYETSVLWKYKFGASKDSSSLIKEKKEKIISSLEMGHMILLRVPNHFIALVGITEDDKIYVFDSGGKGAHLNDIDGIFEYYYYRVSTSYGTECNIALGYEVYPKGGISLEEWKAIK